MVAFCAGTYLSIQITLSVFLTNTRVHSVQCSMCVLAVFSFSHLNVDFCEACASIAILLRTGNDQMSYSEISTLILRRSLSHRHTDTTATYSPARASHTITWTRRVVLVCAQTSKHNIQAMFVDI